MTDDAEAEALAFDQMQIKLFAGLAAWQAPWKLSWLSIGMLERRWSSEEINEMVAKLEANYEGMPSIVFPLHGWLRDLLTTTKPDFMESAFVATEIMHIADAMSGDMHVASGLKKAEDIENRALVEPLFREAIETFSEYVPEGLDAIQMDLYKGQLELLIRSFNMALAAHLLLSGKASESEQLFPGLAANPIFGLSSIVDRVMKSTTNIVAHITGEESLSSSTPSVQTVIAIDENQFNVKHVISSANEDFLSHKPRLPILEKYSHALFILNLSETQSGDKLNASLEKGARHFIDAPYSMPIIGGLFLAADNLLSMRDYGLARLYLLLDAKVRTIEDGQQYGFSKYLSEFMHSFTLAKASMQLGKFEEALESVEDWAQSAETYESPQDMTGRTLGSLLVTRILAQYALLLTLNGRSGESSTWWQKVVSRSECLSVICELCADRLEVKDPASAKKMLNQLKDHALTGDSTNDVVFYWWILNQVNSDIADAVFKEAQSRSDFLNSLADFTSMELLSQRHHCDFAEQMVRIIDTSAIQDELVGVYLQLALEYRQMDQPDKAEENFKKVSRMIDAISTTTLEADPRKIMKLAYLRSAFDREYSLFLERKGSIPASVPHDTE